MSAMRALGMSAALLLSLAPTSMAAGERWQVSVSPTYSSGDIGGDTDVGFLYLPLTARYTFAKGDMTLIVPYLDLQSDGDVTIVGSRVARTPTSSRRNPGATRPGGTRPPESPTPTSPAPPTASVATRERDLGDIGLRARIHVVEERGAWPLLTATLRVNAPTGDPDRGTGCGAVSGTVGMELSKSIGRGYFLVGDASYTRTGDSEQYGVLERWEYAAGVAASLSKTVILSAYFEEWSQATPELPQARDVLVHLGYVFRPTVRFNLGAQIPLSDSAPDFGLVGGVGIRF